MFASALARKLFTVVEPAFSAPARLTALVTTADALDASAGDALNVRSAACRFAISADGD